MQMRKYFSGSAMFYSGMRQGVHILLEFWTNKVLKVYLGHLCGIVAGWF